MKKSLLALAALTAFAGAASAQSSVTLFGIVDASVGRVSISAGPAGFPSKSATGMMNSGLNSSRFGVRGVEDLGGGLQAGFWLEGQLSNDDGNAAGLNFQRRSTVSLMGGFGEIRLGRDYTPSFWNTTVYDPFGTNGVGTTTLAAMTGLIGAAVTNAFTMSGGSISGFDWNTSQAVRANNQVSYFLPAMGGVTGQFTYAFGENVQTSGVTSSKRNNYIGFRVGYAAGPLSAHVAYGKSKGSPTGTLKMSLPGITPVSVALGSGDGDVAYTNFGASFDLGFMQPMVQYAKEKAGGSIAKANTTGWLIGGLVPVGAGTIRFAYTHEKAKNIFGVTGVGDVGLKKLAAGYVHNLSKRTAVYGTLARVSNNDAANMTVSNNGLSAGVGNIGKSSTGYEMGVRHSF